MPIALITGASTGLGREFARLCAREGYDVVLIARSLPQLEELAAEIQQNTNRAARVIEKDLSIPDAPREVFDELTSAGLDIELLINNAGFGLVGRFWELDEMQQMQMVQLNVGALTHLTRLFLPGFVQRRRGQILNIASTAAFQPGPLMAVYYASKAYVVSFSEAVHNEVRDCGVTVTALCPGPTKTEFDKRASGTNTKLFMGRNVMDASVVAQIGLEALKAGKPLVIAGSINSLMAFLTRFAPRQFAASMARRFQEAKYIVPT
jgi:short-subunit dehydrogenase